jgi:hypothetical protein
MQSVLTAVFQSSLASRDSGQSCRWHSRKSEPKLRNPASIASHRGWLVADYRKQGPGCGLQLQVGP